MSVACTPYGEEIIEGGVVPHMKDVGAAAARKSAMRRIKRDRMHRARDRTASSRAHAPALRAPAWCVLQNSLSG